MIPKGKQATDPHLRKQREKQIKDCLKQFDLLPGPYLPGEDHHRLGAVERLAQALIDLGPVFTGFADYLSTRMDRIPAGDGIILNELIESQPAVIIEDVDSLLYQEFGERAATLGKPEPLAAVAGSPFSFYQSRLEEGSPILIKALNPEFDLALHRDGPLLHRLLPTLLFLWPEVPFEDLITDYQNGISHERSLTEVIRLIDQFCKSQVSLEPFQLPRPLHDFCSSQIGVFLLEAGVPFTEVLTRPDWSLTRGIDPVALAGRLAKSWLEHAFCGKWFPVVAKAQHLWITARGKLMIIGGPHFSLPQSTQNNLITYLAATASDQADLAYEQLMKELHPGENAGNEQALKHRFRQVVPFRDGSWYRNTPAESLAEHVFVQWRFASEFGYLAGESLVAFFRGFGEVSRLIMKMEPRRDVLRESLNTMRLQTRMDDLTRLVDLKRMLEQTEKFLSLMIIMPEKIESSLNYRSHTSPSGETDFNQPKLRTREPEPPDSRIPVTVFGYLLVLISLAILTHYFADFLGSWLESFSDVIFLLVGSLLLRAVIGRP